MGAATLPTVLSCLCLAAFSQLNAQDCASRAMRTVSSAQIEAYAKHGPAAQRLLKEAVSQCPADARVLLEAAEVYKIIGDDGQASFLIDSAARLGPVSGKSTSPGPAAPATSGTIQRKWALAVGISRFQNAGIPTLAFPAKDAKDFAGFLAGPSGRFSSGQVAVLTNEFATTAGIRTALAHIADNDRPDDLVVLFFSTHGTSPDMDRSNLGAGYLLTHDADPARLYATSFGMDELARFIQQNFHARRVVLFLDTCYSGDTARIMRETNAGAGSKTVVPLGASASQGNAGSVSRIAQAYGRVVIASSSRQEQSWESPDLRNGFFTSALIQALQRKQGQMNVLDLFSEITATIPTAVREYTRKRKLAGDRDGAVQTPQLFPAAGVPDIVIGAPAVMP